MNYYTRNKFTGEITKGKAERFSQVSLQHGDVLYNPHTKEDVIGWRNYIVSMAESNKKRFEHNTSLSLQRSLTRFSNRFDCKLTPKSSGGVLEKGNRKIKVIANPLLKINDPVKIQKGYDGNFILQVQAKNRNSKNIISELKKALNIK